MESELQGFYKDARRGSYGNGVKGIDYPVNGIGNYEHSMIKIITKQIRGAIKLLRHQLLKAYS